MQCGKCYGKGYIPTYRHISGGICFACNGKGFIASNGKVERTVKIKQITHCFPGFTKREMKEVIEDSLVGVAWQAKSENVQYEKYVRCGLYSKRISDKGTIFYTPIASRTQLSSLYDLSL